MERHNPGSAGYHMSTEDFRRHGHQLVDWIADYLDHIEEHPIWAEVEPGDIRKRIPDAAPEQPEAFDDLLRDLDDVVMPGVTHWQAPGWFAYFPANTSPVSILGEMAAAGLGVQGMLWSTSPAVTEVEHAVLDWLVDLLGLPTSWKIAEGPGGGVLQMTASDSTHTALVVARHQMRHLGPAERMVAYTSRQAHSSVEKGARVAGYGHIRLVDVDGGYAMRPEALAAAIDQDRGDGLIPVFVASTVGTTGTTAVDPVAAIAEIATKEGLWHHVDAAYAGTAMLCPELRHHQAGLESVDSYAFNPHKWMFTNFDCSAFYVADRRPLIDTLSITPPYLRNTASDSGAVIDYRDWHVPLGRRFRALKLWWVLRSYGAEGLRHHVRRHIELAADLADRIDRHPALELFAPVPFGLVCFRHVDGNDATDAIAERINTSGHSYVTPSETDGVRFVRVAVGQTRTEIEHIGRLWELIDTAS